MNFVCKKIRYGSRKFALEDIFWRTKNDKKKKIPRLYVYSCKCGAWHLTSKCPRKKIKKEMASNIDKIKNQKLEISNLLRANKSLLETLAEKIEALAEKDRELEKLKTLLINYAPEQ